jgi:hypothetical protein
MVKADPSVPASLLMSHSYLDKVFRSVPKELDYARIYELHPARERSFQFRGSK